MKKLLVNLMIMGAFVLLLASCGTTKNYNFKASGITSRRDSTYLITVSGRHINANDIDVIQDRVTVDGKKYPLDSISSVTSKQMYYAVQRKKVYFEEYDGRINIFYRWVDVADRNGYGWTSQKQYYIQKRGSKTIDKLTAGIVVDYVSDNAEALKVAKDTRRWSRAYFASWLGIAGGGIYAFSNLFSSGGTDANGHVKSFNVVGPSIVLTGSLAVMAVARVTSQQRMFKAINIYNR